MDFDLKPGLSLVLLKTNFLKVCLDKDEQWTVIHLNSETFQLLTKSPTINPKIITFARLIR